MPANKAPSYMLNGYQMLVRGAIAHSRYRNSFEKPESFVPGKITDVKFTMNNVAHTLKKRTPHNGAYTKQLISADEP
jgi:hypothetical protein